MANGNTVLQGYMVQYVLHRQNICNTIHPVEGMERSVNALEDPRLPLCEFILKMQCNQRILKLCNGKTIENNNQ